MTVKLPSTNYLSSFFVILLFAVAAFSQTNDTAGWLRTFLDDERLEKADHKNRITKHDFGPMWTAGDNASVFGFIGDDYQRLRVKILTAHRDPRRPDTYNITGKSMVRNVVRAFTGTMKITAARVYKDQHDGDGEYKSRGVKEHGFVAGEYHFAEDKNQTSTGTFDGVFVTNWYIDRGGRLKYDDVESFSDGYSNNQFAGTWTSYRSGAKRTANWGDSRIPLSGDLDIGAGEFSPDDKYLKNGWQSYRDAYQNNSRKALAEERRQWWR